MNKPGGWSKELGLGALAALAMLVILAVPSSAFQFSTYSNPPTDKVVFAHQGAVYVCNADGSDLTRLTDIDVNNDYGLNPCWSPDGTKIAYVMGYGTPNAGIYIMNADGGNQHFVTNGWNPSFSPDGAKIVYESAGTVLNSALQVINIDGTGATRLADGSTPDWSPDGARIYYCVRFPSTYALGEIYVMNSDGSNQTKLTTTIDSGPASDPICTSPAVSPDGSKVVYVRRDASGFEHGYAVYSMNTDGSNNLLLARLQGANTPDWSSDGTRIAVTSFLGAAGENYGIFIMKADGSSPYRLTYGYHASICRGSVILPY